MKREHRVWIVTGLSIIDQDRKQVGVGRSLRADNDRERIRLCSRRGFERFVERRTRTTDLAEFVLDHQRGRKPISSSGIGTERAITRTQFRTTQRFRGFLNCYSL